MGQEDDLLRTTGTFVVDSFSLYSIVVGHSPDGLTLRASAQNGEIHLVTSAVALAVAVAMRTCWNSECDQEHPSVAGASVREFHERGAVEVAELTSTDAMSAAQLYIGCAERRIGGAEVLAACHSVLLAESRAAPLVSTIRASYCYTAIPEATAGQRITLI
ncbi:hypothetical protein [Actinophytocola sp.]|uniref:hypothetical protein n=1 Tax=Actinophytocola sp. TaxID=1872138 RepID=UPI003D6B0E11